MTEEKNKAPRLFGRFSKPLLPALYILLLMLGMQMGGYQYVLLDMGREFHMQNTMMGTLVAVQFVAITLAPLAVGRVSDRIGKQKVILLGMLLFGTGCLLTALGSSVGLVCLGVFVIGAGYSICETLVSASFADNYPKTASKHISRSQTMFSAGAMIGPLLASALMESGTDWRGIFLFLPAMCLLLMIPMSLARFQVVLSPAQKKEPGSLKTVLLAPVLILCTAAIFCMTGSDTAGGFFLDSLFETVLDAPHLGALAVSIMHLTMMLTRLVISFFGRPSLLSAIGFGASALILAALSFVQSPLLGLILIGCLGVGFGPVWPGIISTVALDNRGNSGLATGILVAATGFGGGLFTVIAGVVADAMTVGQAYLMLALLQCIGLVTLTLARRQLRRKGVSV